MSDEIVVTARRLPREFDFSTFPLGTGTTPPAQFFDSISVDNDFYFAPSLPTDGTYQPPPQIVAEEELDLNAALRNAFSLAILSLHTKLGSASGNLSIQTSDGKVVTIDQLYSNWLNLNFLITLTKEYPPGFGGQVSNTETGYLSSMRLTTLEGYAAHGKKGLTYLALHEVAHTTPVADEYYASKWRDFLAAGGDPNNWADSDQFKDNERYVNRIARDFAQAIGLETFPEAPFGY